MYAASGGEAVYGIPSSSFHSPSLSPIASKREWDERERGEGKRGEGREEETGFVFRLAFYDLRANGQAARQMASETHS